MEHIIKKPESLYWSNLSLRVLPQRHSKLLVLKVAAIQAGNHEILVTTFLMFYGRAKNIVSNDALAVTPVSDLIITHVSLSKECKDPHTRTFLTLSVAGTPGQPPSPIFTIGGLNTGNHEHLNVCIRLDQGVKYLLQKEGPNNLSVLGFHEHSVDAPSGNVKRKATSGASTVTSDSKNSTAFIIDPNGNVPGVSVSNPIPDRAPTPRQPPTTLRTPSPNAPSSTGSVKRSAPGDQDIAHQPMKKLKSSGAPANTLLPPSAHSIRPSSSDADPVNGLSFGQSQFSFIPRPPTHASPTSTNSNPAWSGTHPVPGRIPANITPAPTSTSSNPAWSGTDPLPANWSQMPSNLAPPSSSSSSSSPWSHNRALPGPNGIPTTSGHPLADSTPRTMKHMPSRWSSPPTGVHMSSQQSAVPEGSALGSSSNTQFHGPQAPSST
ncbi:hypothetical protein BT96DRAFT_950623 [Gymnopus androsaceus JB14]|uniref:Nucleoplasmin-like domain-containing protein n=1 Tax=Gymnopus androsaceus JB14 TaxID=1447944 RepID=A0A6A4GG31_9AGAR|nr:hypothetical protein BT96DRAFT_950623 [Gymnopus androsaceus JB14]